MIEKFIKTIDNNKLLEDKSKVLLAISGGIDSVVLLHLLHSRQYRVEAAHCNFKLRGTESDEDESFVIDYCKKLGVVLHLRSFDTKEFAYNNKLSIQVAARELRYSWFGELMQECGFDKLAVAHHFDDNLETLFINLLRTSGLQGVKGIPLKNGYVIRPLLDVPRSSILEYAKAHSLDFREDSSNKSAKYLRNKIRHKLIPVLMDLVPDAENSLAKSMGFLADDNDIFNRLIDEKRSAIFEYRNDGIYVPHSKLIGLKPVKSWIYRLLRIFNFSRASSDGIAEALFNKQSGKMFFSETHRLVNDREYFIVNKLHANEENEEVLIAKSCKGILRPLHLTFETVANKRDFIIGKEKDAAYFDFDRLSFPLYLRKWHKSDRFKPFGMKGTKLLSDFFIDNKLSVPEKEKARVLLSGGQIIWIVGMRAADSFKVTENTRYILKVKISQKM
ncbi:MAG: tRNA lysidine(34) synthetase TilS [Chlorobi bacterium]|nr:tRNA lysidine(34) synthetase TilS [Chlorobiota bacterium]